MNVRMLGALIGCLVGTSCLPAQDLAKLDRKLVKQPDYAGEKIGYCLLVFGPKAETKVWLVHDPGKDWFDVKDDVLYIDRNGNGDLTDAGERIAATVRTEEIFLSFKPGVETVSLPAFAVGDLVESGGIRHTHLEVNGHGYLGSQRQFTISVKIGGKHLQSTSDGLLRFGASPKESPVIHFNGPLALHLNAKTGIAFVPSDGSPPSEEEMVLVPGKSIRISALLGTKGIGSGTFAALTANFPPQTVHPVAEFTFPHRDPAQPAIKTKLSLTLRCCSVQFSEVLQVPADAATGKATVQLTMPGWEGHHVNTAKFEMAVSQPK